MNFLYSHDLLLETFRHCKEKVAAGHTLIREALLM